MEKPTFTRASLSNVRVIIMIMHVPVVQRLCQTVIGWIPVLKCLLSSACGCLCPCPIVPGIKCCKFLRFWLWWCLLGTKSSCTRLPGAWMCPEPGGGGGGGADVNQVDKWQNPACPWYLRWGKVLAWITTGRI
jgi:hypothetical protein